MKKTALFVVLILLGTTIVSAQTMCSKYYPLKEGATFEYAAFDKKGNPDGTTYYSIPKVSNTANETTATFAIRFTNKKGKEQFNTEYGITCTGDGIKIDYTSILPSDMMSQYEDMDLEMDITGTDMELPNELNTGKQLKDANVNVEMSTTGIKMNISVDVLNRLVVAQESITTSAGTFDCYVLTETIKSKAMGANIEMNSKTWLSEGVGMVKQEQYNKKGVLTGSTVLAKYSN